MRSLHNRSETVKPVTKRQKIPILRLVNLTLLLNKNEIFAVITAFCKFMHSKWCHYATVFLMKQIHILESMYNILFN